MGRGRGGEGEDGMRFTLNIFSVSYLDQIILWMNFYGVTIQMERLCKNLFIVLFISLVLIHNCSLGRLEEGHRYCYLTTYSVWI